MSTVKHFVDKSGRFVGTFVGEYPENCVEVSSPPLEADYIWRGGKWDSSLSKYSLFDERVWRDEELRRADVELCKVQDSDSKAVGTVAEWRQYRKDLRDWPEHPNFPVKDFRPKAPDSK